MALPDLQRHEVSLDALFPGVVLPCVYEPERGLIWFPVATVCERLSLDARSQRARVQREYPGHIEKFRLPTDGGPQELLCIEYEALALWIATAQDGKATPLAQERLRRFRALVMAGASDILLGRSTPMPFDERRQRSRALAKEGEVSDQMGLLMEHDTRIGSLERAVFVGEPPEDDGRVARCPHCGGAIRVTASSFNVVADHE
jgi:hypothetical protein